MLKRAVLLLLCWFVLPALGAHAQWRYEDAAVTMTEPVSWVAMSAQLLETTNQQVKHVTGGAFVAGYQANDGDTLLFPYMLMQYVPYSSLAPEHQPTHRLDEREALQLIGRLVKNLSAPDPLPEGMTTDQFHQEVGSSLVRLAHLGSDGRFELVGTIPFADGSGEIAYHTAGALGRSGVAYATVFSIEGIDLVQPIIDGAASTIGFAEGAGWDALPLRDRGVVGFLAPPAQPLPRDALLVADDRFGVVSASGFYVLEQGRFDPKAALLTGAIPQALRGVSFDLVLTRTPASDRISHPWAASGLVPWSMLGLADALERRPTRAQWTSVIAGLLAMEPSVIERRLAGVWEDPASFSTITGVAAQGEAGPWVLRQADFEFGRFALTQRAAAPDDPLEPMVRRLTLVAGVNGLAVLVSQTYADVVAEDVALLESMGQSMRFAGDGRLVDVPPADAQDEAGGGGAAATDVDPNNTAALSQTPSGTEPTAGDKPNTPPAGSNNAKALAMPLMLGGLGGVMVIVVGIVVFMTHQKANRQREKARARREQRAGQ